MKSPYTNVTNYENNPDYTPVERQTVDWRTGEESTQTIYVPKDEAEQAKGVPIPPRKTDVQLIPYFVMYTLISSYWYHKAWEGQLQESSTPKNRFAYNRAIYYDKLASEYRSDEALRDYHKAYKSWKSVGFDLIEFEKINGWSFTDSSTWRFI